MLKKPQVIETYGYLSSGVIRSRIYSKIQQQNEVSFTARAS
ncbi:hypothetical protein VCHA54P500_410002 [Vibrio chagasii]|nr:hypothetical protein VCHA34P112_20257 [Vibrio chagasii]CAH6918815.1 hypothetical protein VCHA43P275_120101 [Vibrio chagasii]CAH7194084.1 hypothetical protein VCHA56P515_20257 [Vibrio chagasii]CAH7219024.1 hypothetical protein VCHA48P439_400002 [Vibrio chagasii]CAH7236630.1 hypothetical protein VCHA40O236_400002 [Vibrio chagasii]